MSMSIVPSRSSRAVAAIPAVIVNAMMTIGPMNE